MSRCFPYPPPGYTLSRADEDALIESIKLQKEKAKAKGQRKERKREKKERRKKEKKEKKQKANQNLDKYITSKEQLAKSILANSEHLERSGLTEEHGQPICLGSTSSDSTENSNKRKRHSSPNNGSRCHDKVIRIRLASKKQDVPDAPIKCCSTSRTDDLVQNDDNIGFRRRQQTFSIPSEVARNLGQASALRSDKELICSTTGKNGTVAPGRIGIPSAPDVAMTSTQRQELLYRNLIENLVPPQLQDTCFDSDDLGWLFHGKNQDGRAEKRQKSENDSLSCASTSLSNQLHARYLPEFDVYALPYTVPF